MNKMLQMIAALALLSSATAFAGESGKTTVEVSAEATSDSRGRGEVRGSVEVSSGKRETGEVAVKGEARRNTEGSGTQSAEITYKKSF
jgi:hypothetical protein